MMDIVSTPALIALGYLLSALGLRLLSQAGLADWRAAHTEQRPVRDMTFWSPLIRDAWRPDGIPCRLPDAEDLHYRDIVSTVPLLNTLMLLALLQCGLQGLLVRTFLPAATNRH